MKNGTVKEDVAQAVKFELLEPLEVLEDYEETLVTVDDAADKQIELFQVQYNILKFVVISSSNLLAFRSINICFGFRKLHMRLTFKR